MRRPAAFIFILFFVSACSIVGVHFKLHNPSRAGKYPEPTKELTLFGDQDSRYRQCFNVSEYRIDLSFSGFEKNDSISGSVFVQSESRWETDTLQFDAGTHLIIDSVTGAFDDEEGYKSLQWQRLKFERAGRSLFVIYPEPIPEGYNSYVVLYFHGRPPDAKRPPWRGGFVREKDDLGNPWWGVACQSEGASLWWPCKDVVDDEPEWATEISFTVPRGFTAVSNGVLRKHSVDSLHDYWSWSVHSPINLYNITFYIGKYKLLHDTYTSKVTGDTLGLNHYVLEQHYDKAKEHFKQVKDHLAFYEEVFGPYAFYDDGFKLVESPYAGMEHQTAIAYGNKFKNNYLGFDYIILHETAHEWWGNSVTAEDLAEGWIHEGFATYAECLYVERTKGYMAYLDYLRNYKFTIVNRRPLVGVYGIRYFNYKDGDIYTKGAWVLHTLRTTIGNDSVFFDIIKTFATRYMYKNATTEDFAAIVNEKTGEEYKWFFDQYCHNRFVPELEYCKDGNRFLYSWKDEYTNSDFRLPIVLRGVNTGRADTIIPRWGIERMDSRGDEEPYMAQKLLVKFTENKKLKKEYKKQRKVGVPF